MTPDPPPLPARPSASSHDTARKTKLILNRVAAVILVLLALWMTVADFAFRGNLIFQDSGSAPFAALYLAGLFVVLLVLAPLPKRLVVTANLLILVRVAMGWPLSMVTGLDFACRLASAGLLVVGAWYLVASLRPGLLRLGERPWLRLRHSLLALLLWIGTGILSAPVLVLGYVEAAKSLVGDYVQVSWQGISLVERVFEKDRQIVHLVGMMHIGSSSFYSDLNQRMRTPLTDRTRIILAEGVSDEQGILPDGFKSGETYARLARSLGLTPQAQHSPGRSRPSDRPRQPPPEIPGVTFVNADIDISALDPEHQQLLVTVLGLLDVDHPLELLLIQPDDISGREIEHLFFDGLLTRRNDVLMEHFDRRATGHDEVFIPWGAAHLPDIEQRLLARGYTKRGETVRPIVRFRSPG